MMQPAPIRKRHLQLVHSRAMPLTRGECVGGPRPCAWTTCRHNLTAEVLRSGAVKMNWDPALHPERPSCSLDVASDGGTEFTRVAEIMGVSRQRLDQIERSALRKMSEARRRLRQFYDP